MSVPTSPDAIAKSAALELGRAGIRINTVCPAGGNPEMYGPWFPQLMEFKEESRAYIENRVRKSGIRNYLDQPYWDCVNLMQKFNRHQLFEILS